MSSPTVTRPGAIRDASAAFIARRGEMNLTQADVARKGPVSLRTVQGFEAAVRWPHPRTRARLERAVGWENGELARIAFGVAS